MDFSRIIRLHPRPNPNGAMGAQIIVHNRAHRRTPFATRAVTVWPGRRREDVTRGRRKIPTRKRRRKRRKRRMAQGAGRAAGRGSLARAMGFGPGYPEGTPPRTPHSRLFPASPSRPVPALLRRFTQVHQLHHIPLRQPRLVPQTRVQ